MKVILSKKTLTLLVLAAVQVTWVPVLGNEAVRNETLQRLHSIKRTADYVVGVIRHVNRNLERLKQNGNFQNYELIKEKLQTLSTDLGLVSEKVETASNSDGDQLAGNVKVLKVFTRQFHKTLKNLTSDMKVTATSLKGQRRTQVDRDIKTLERGGNGLMERVKRLPSPASGKTTSRREDSRAGAKSENTASSNVSATGDDLRFRSLIRGPDDDFRLAKQEVNLMQDTGRSLMDMARMVDYLDRCPGCMVRTETYQCPMHGPALDMQKWAKQLQDLVSFGCAIPDGCDGNTKCCLSADLEVQKAITSVTKTLRDLYTTFQKSCTKCNKILQDEAKPDEWTTWGPWGSCDVTCGTNGRRMRERQCVRPTTRERANRCAGAAVETGRCPAMAACETIEWSSWGSWSSCDVTCGREGLRTRERDCLSFPSRQRSNRCAGSAREQGRCPPMAPCETIQWGSWGSWSSCDVTCGTDGTRTRERDCISFPSRQRSNRCSGGLPVERGSCPLAPCPIQRPEWGSWGPWSSCSATCDRGVMYRRRSCQRSPDDPVRATGCVGDGEERRACDAKVPCCVDGNWSPWSSWGACSTTCGRGESQKRRTCSNPAPNHCGRTCPGSAVASRVCGLDRECCVDGNWGQWLGWSACSMTCGDGVQSNRRRCDDPEPNFCGRRCAGNMVTTRSCNLGECCVDGNWSNWGRWSECSATCDSGMRRRERQCSNPSPSACGRSCPGSAIETETCQAGRPCEVCVDGNWGSWQSWSSCSVSCGSGMRTRRRECDSPPRTRCGKPCPGNSEQSEVCTNRGRDGNWGNWGAWSACSASCGPGEMTRRRVCDSPAPDGCGFPCMGQDRDKKMCNERECCIDGNWGFWQSWSSCSVTCGRGERQRERLCDSPPANYCGQRCRGRANDIEACDSGIPCCVDGNWGSWSAWSPCSTTCGEALRTRTRSCDSPPANECGRPCPGDGIETKTELCGMVPVDGRWSQWSQWSPCSATCGVGHRTRERDCTSPRPNACGRKCDVGIALDRETCVGSEGTCDCELRAWAAWGPWESCSKTCGLGVRERKRECGILKEGRDCGFGLGSCQEGSSTEVGQCIETPVCRDATWGPWGSWGPCLCRTAKRTRRRQCYRSLPGEEVTVVTPNLCTGDDEQDEPCSPSQRCPDCLTSCSGKPDGQYPTCGNCGNTVVCSRGRPEAFLDCEKGAEWDAFAQKCVYPPSPTCMIHDCCRTCVGKPDGFYPDCESCNSYIQCVNGEMLRASCAVAGQEWNQITQRCEPAPSPTCRREFTQSRHLVTHDHIATLYVEEAGKVEQLERVKIHDRIATIDGSKIETDDKATGNNQGGGGAGGTGSVPQGMVAPGPERNGVIYVTDSQGQGRIYQQGQGGQGGWGTWTRTEVRGGGSGGGTTYVYGGGDGASSGTGTGTRVNIGSGISGTRTYVGGSGSGTSGTRTYVGGSGSGTSGTRTYVGGSGSGNSGTRTYVSGSGSGTSGTRTFVGGSGIGTSGTVSVSGSAGSLSGGVVPVNVFTVPDCVSDCVGAIPGKYPSCAGCEYYVQCTRNGRLRQRKCQSNRKWDDKLKKCTQNSSTCP